MIEDPDETNNLSNDLKYKETTNHLLSIIQDGWNSKCILEHIGRKALDVDLLKQWTQATNASEEYRWFPEFAK